MQEQVKDIIIELADDTVFIRDAKTNSLLRAKVFRPDEALERYKELIKIYKGRCTTK